MRHVAVSRPLRGLCCALAVGLSACSSGVPDPSAEAGSPAHPERVLAEVNGVPILARDVEKIRQADRLRMETEAGASDARSEVDRRREALELAIRGELIHQAALARGIEVPDEQLDEQLQVSRSQFGSDDEFHAYLEQNGLSVEGLRAAARRRLMMRAYARSVTDDLVLDAARAESLFDAHRDTLGGGEEVRAAQILVRLRPGADEAERRQARRKIEEAHRRAVAGEDFAALARAYSESPLAERGGDLGFFARGRMLPEFETVVFATPTAAITPVFETPHGLNVVKVLERRDSAEASFEEVQTGLLLVLAREQKDARLREHVDRLRAAADVRILDPELADD